jgi:hypothetical protein
MATADVNDTRLVQNRADTDDGWNQGVVNNTTYAELQGSITEAIDTTSDSIFYDATPRSLVTYPLVYIWSTNIADQGTWKPGTADETPHGMVLSDTSNNTIVLMNSGSDREVFKHQETQTTFQCLMIDAAYLDTKDTDGEIYEQVGDYASFDPTVVDKFGAYFTTLAKAFKGWNCGVDIIRLGGYGDYVEFYAGTSGDPIDFESCAVEDRSTGVLEAHGIIRTYTANTFGCQGRLGLGSDQGAAYFEHDGFVLVFEDRDVTDNAFGLRFHHGHDTTPFTTIILKNGSIGSAGPGVDIEDTGTEQLDLTIEGVAFNSLKNALIFPADYFSGSGSITGCTFNGCGQIDPGPADFQSNVISNTTTTTTGAVLLDSVVDPDTWSGNTWNYGGGGTEAAIHITAIGTYTFTDHAFVGYGATDSNTAALYNDSGGLVTIINSGSTGITYRNEGASTTTVTGSATTTVTVATTTGTKIENARVFLQATDGTGPLPFEDTVNITSASTTASVAHNAHGLLSGQQIALRGAEQEEYNGVYPISNVTTNAYDYTFAGSGTSPATGTIKATGVLIHDLSNASGVVTDTRSLSSNQPVTGHARKSSGSPFYKSSSIVGTVDSADGAGFTAVMILDE